MLVSASRLQSECTSTPSSGCSVTCSPGGDAEGDVGLGEEQQDGGGHGAEGEAIRPAVTEAADGVQRPGGGDTVSTEVI